MKKIIFILSLICFQIQASTTSIIDKHLSKGENLIGKTMDSIYTIPTKIVNTTKDGTTFVDTSSNFKMIYTDIKSGINAIAHGLKMGAEHVYIILVKKYLIDGVSSLITLLITIIFFIWLFNYAKTKIDFNKNFEFSFPIIIIGSCTLVFLIFQLTSLNNILNNIFNPEYGALEFILKKAIELKR